MASNYAICKNPIGYLKILEMGCAIGCIVLICNNGCLSYHYNGTGLQSFGFLCSGSSLFISFFILIVNIYFYQDDKAPYLEAVLTAFMALLHLPVMVWILAFTAESFQYCYALNSLLWLGIITISGIIHSIDSYFTFKIIREINEKKASIYFIPLGNQEICLPVLKRKNDQYKSFLKDSQFFSI